MIDIDRNMSQLCQILYEKYYFNISSFLFLNNQPDAPIIQIYSTIKLFYVSGIFSAHHQEFSTVYSTLVSFMKVYDDRFQAESG
jgi:hypothetical protein